ncbi:MAG TPA: TadE/TadG family type IV pilus assembly protein [Nocardioides sp.]|nr:TadE/TadG family type IV pilus assembly protein [Nocardioides sp.]
MVGGLARRTRVRGREHGAAAVEFALVVPVLLLIVFGIISYGYMLSFRQALSQGAAEGARAAAVSPLPAQADKQQAALDAVNEALDSYGVACAGTAVGSNLMKGTTDVGSCSVATAACTNDGTKDCVTASLDYEYADHPLLPSVPGLGVLLPDHLRYEAVAQVSG